MRQTLLSFTLLCVPLFAQLQISKIAFTESKEVIDVFTPYGHALLPMARERVEIKNAGGSETGELVVVYDPDHGHYLWHVTTVLDDRVSNPADFVRGLKAGYVAVYAGPSGLVEMLYLRPIYITEHRETANSLDAAESAAIEELQKDVGATKRGFDRAGTKVVGFLGPDPMDALFDCAEPMSAYCPPIAKFVSVGREGENWRVLMRGTWDQELILNEKFLLVKTRRLPSHASPPALR
jgi:hypothetical protein